MKKILVVSCSARSSIEKENILIYQSLRILKHEVRLELHYDNKTPLPVVYNRYLTPKYKKKYDIVVFAHDDVYIDDLKLRGKLYGGLKQFDIVGLAGCLNPVIKAPAMWHLMSEPKDYRGFVGHAHKQDVNLIHMSAYGPSPSRVMLVDGLFMAVNLETVLNTDWKFNENFSFHHYDLAASLDANYMKLKLGVIPIHAIHASMGLHNYHDKEFQQSQSKFLE